MKSIEFVTLPEAMLLHKKTIDRFGGILGVRDLGLLESALMQPQMSMFDEYIYKDIFQMGSAYFYHIIKNHPFLDGNKRAGLLITLVFFQKNNMSIIAQQDELYQVAMDTAASKMTKEELAVFFKRQAQLID
ncbi:MAG: type II toxin-antitoxin system death-on-curing family toxin [Candidatus Babeliales bacterium]|nr:type II toxin-antitoxin system death-on-curing family toxin [Candidatus Babeliales bacterium]